MSRLRGKLQELIQPAAGYLALKVFSATILYNNAFKGIRVERIIAELFFNKKSYNGIFSDTVENQIL